MFPLDWLLAIFLIAFVMTGLGGIFCLMCFWEVKGGRFVELLASANISGFLVSIFGMAAVILASTYLSFGWLGIMVAAVTFILLFAVKMGWRARKHPTHHAW